MAMMPNLYRVALVAHQTTAKTDLLYGHVRIRRGVQFLVLV